MHFCTIAALLGRCVRPLLAWIRYAVQHMGRATAEFSYERAAARAYLPIAYAAGDIPDWVIVGALNAAFPIDESVIIDALTAAFDRGEITFTAGASGGGGGGQGTKRPRPA